jgi:hypothetical protein
VAGATAAISTAIDVWKVFGDVWALWDANWANELIAHDSNAQMKNKVKIITIDKLKGKT